MKREIDEHLSDSSQEIFDNFFRIYSINKKQQKQEQEEGVIFNQAKIKYEDHHQNVNNANDKISEEIIQNTSSATTETLSVPKKNQDQVKKQQQNKFFEENPVKNLLQMKFQPQVKLQKQTKGPFPEQFIFGFAKKRQFGITPSNVFSMFILDNNLTDKQVQLQIQKQKIYFPYQPYQSQKRYMQKVIKTLNLKQNAVLQSPTGTGKTLCLLTSILAWAQTQYRQKKQKIKIIYTSRTHSQLRQVQKQLNKTCYRPNMAIFAAREQLCIKKQFSELKGKQKIEACGKAVKITKKFKNNPSQIQKLKQSDPKLAQSACEHYQQKEFITGISKTKLNNKILNIQLMKKYGEQQNFCPYFYPTFVKNSATLFLAPYNYILDVYLLPNFEEIITGSIIIFDEAHNVSEAACEGRSLMMDMHNLQGALVQLNKIELGTTSGLASIRDSFRDQLRFVIKKLEDYKQYFNEYLKDKFNTQSQYAKNVREQIEVKLIHKQQINFVIYQLFCGKILSDEKRKRIENDQAFFKQQLLRQLLKPIEQITNISTNIIQSIKETAEGFFANFQKIMIFFTKVHQLLRPTLYKAGPIIGIINQQPQINHFRLYFNKIPNQKENNSLNFTIGLKCLIPELTFDSIKRLSPLSMILTSGTLKPLQMWDKQLKINFNNKLINGHVINPDQISTVILQSGPSQVPFNFTFDSLSRNKQRVFRDLIDTVCNICRRVPNGVVLVFPSFKLQSDFRFQLQKSAKKYQLQRIKSIIFEQRSRQFDMRDYKKKSLTQKGALLVIICRGRLSQGIDFPDEFCRAVILVGIPYPNIKDPFITQKKSHLEYMASRAQKKSDCLRGDQWYTMGTIRSINQALGRVIRHANDYGMIFLVDNRYNQKRFQKQLPKWATQNITPFDYVNSKLYDHISEFYDRAKRKYPGSQAKQFTSQEQQLEVVKPKLSNGFEMIMANRKKMKKMTI